MKTKKEKLEAAGYVIKGWFVYANSTDSGFDKAVGTILESEDVVFSVDPEVLKVLDS